MAEARKIQVPILKPPPKYELLLTEEEAATLKDILGCIGGRGTPSSPLVLQPASASNLRIPEDDFYGGPREVLGPIWTALRNAIEGG